MKLILVWGACCFLSLLVWLFAAFGVYEFITR